MSIPKKFVHYGCTTYDPKLFDPIKNRKFIKPYGGLWGTSLNGLYSWKNWCFDKEYCVDKLNISFIFTLKDFSKVFYLATREDCKVLPLQDKPDVSNRQFYADDLSFEDFYLANNTFVDYEKLAHEYDALYFPDPYGELRWSFYGWDCESLLVFNKDSIIPLEKEI